MDKEFDTSFTHQCASVKTSIRLPASQFRNKSGNQQIAMLVGMYPLSNQLIPLPLNYDTSVSGGNGVAVSESKVLAVSGVLDVARKERLVWLQFFCQKLHKSPFMSTE